MENLLRVSDSGALDDCLWWVGDYGSVFRFCNTNVGGKFGRSGGRLRREEPVCAGGTSRFARRAGRANRSSPPARQVTGRWSTPSSRHRLSCGVHLVLLSFLLSCLWCPQPSPQSSC